MGPAALRFFHSLARKNLTKNQGSGIITIPNRMTSESEASAMIQTIVDSGLPLEKFDQFIRSEDDILKYLNIIKNANKQRVIPADSPEGRQITEQLFGKRGEVVDMTGKKIDTRKGIMGGKSIEDLMDSGQVTKGARGMKKSKKVQDREMFKAANERLTSDVDSIIKNIKSMEPITALKEANSVIARKGKYKNLTPAQSKKILQDTEDHIFERDIPEDPEGFAKGGRIGFKGGADMGTVADSKGQRSARSVSVSPSGSVTTSRTRGPDGPDDRSNFTQNVNHREAMRNYQRPTESKIKKAIETGSEISFLNNLYKMNPVGLGLNIGGKMLYNKFFDDQAMLDTEDEGIMQVADLNPLGLTQMRNLEKKKAMEPLGGDPFTDKDQQMLDELERRDADPDKTYGPVLAADGGIIRANFVGGGMGRRGFLKMLAGLGAGIGAAKTGLLKLTGKEPVKQVAKEVVQKSTTTPPPYFFKLAEKIKMMGDDATATTDRTIAKTLKSKDGKSTYVLEEDVATGDTIIKKVNKEGDEMMTDVEIMELKKGEVVMGKDGKPVKVPDEYEEVTEVNARIEGDTFNDPYFVDGIKIDEIIKEVGEQAPSIKKAGGGIARMLGE